MSGYQTETQITREGLFKFGQWFSLQNLKYTYYRVPIARLICVVTVDDALRKGWTVVEPGNEKPVKWNQDAQKHIRNHLPELLQAYYFARRDGESLLGAFEHEGTFIIRAFPKGDYNLVLDDVGAIKSGWATSKYINHQKQPKHIISKDNRDRFIKVILKRRDRQYEGLSELEGVWDTIFALTMLQSHSAYFVARAGGGKKTVVVPEGHLDDSGDLMSTLLTTAANFGSAHDVAFVPATIGGLPVEFKVETVDNPTDFLTYHDMYIRDISMATGIPGNIVKGILATGEPEGAIVAEEGYFDVLRDIQYLTEGYNKWFMYQLNDNYELNAKTTIGEEKESFDLLYATRKVMSVMDEMELLVKQAEVVKALKEAGLKAEEAFKRAKFTDVTPDMIEEKPEMMALPPGNGTERPVGGSKEGRPFPPTKAESKKENQPQMIAKK